MSHDVYLRTFVPSLTRIQVAAINSPKIIQNPKKSVLPMDCTSNSFSQECAGSDHSCRQDDGEDIFYQKLSYRNIFVDMEEQSIPCTPRTAQACKKIPVTVITSVKHSKVKIYIFETYFTLKYTNYCICWCRKHRSSTTS